MACLIQAGRFPDVLLGQNLNAVNGSQFSVPWYYRASFSLAPGEAARSAVLTFKGVSYKADVYVNGALVALNTTLRGTFRVFEFALPRGLLRAGANAVAVRLWRPYNTAFPGNGNKSTDLSTTFVDWAPEPPDGNMGLWREVTLALTGGVTARYPLVRTALSAPAAPPGAGAPGAPASNVTAAVTIGVRLASSLGAAATGALACQLRAPSGASVAHLLLPAVALAAGEARDVFFEPAAFPQLLLQAPALWWPWQMGPPTLHALACNFSLAGGGASDAFTAAVGLREMTSEIIAPPRAPSARLFRVNGNNVLVKGGGWAPDLFLRQPADRLAAEIAYTRDMGLNAIRLEGKMNPEPFFDATDAAGLLVLPGWCCCDAWQNWAGWGPEQYLIANESTKSEALRLRGHASILMFFVSSDEVPPEAVSTMYLQALNASAWPNPTVASAGSDGVKMSGPYSWVPPVYWSIGATGDALPLGSGVWGKGAAFGFLTEGGPGENPMQLASLAAMADNSSEALWPPRPDDCWGHCGFTKGNFGHLERFTGPLAARFGFNSTHTDGAAQFSYASQVAAYETHRAMFEAYGRNKDVSTGVIQWMLNSAWPSNVWNLYDWFLSPSATYFAAKRANELLHLAYTYADASIWAINGDYSPTAPLWAAAEVFDTQGTTLWENATAAPGVGADNATRVLQAPSAAAVAALLRRLEGAAGALPGAYFLRLTLRRSAADALPPLSQSVYWLSTAADVLDWDKSSWYTTPCSAFADYASLRRLPRVALQAVASINAPSGSAAVNVTAATPGVVAFFIRVRLVDNATAEEVAPVQWSDNFFTLKGGETAALSATFPPQPQGRALAIVTDVYNNVMGGL